MRGLGGGAGYSMLESSFFLLAFLSGSLLGSVLGGMVSEVVFGVETRNDRFFITGGAIGGTVLALSAAAVSLPGPL
jgi:hypothetical protein